MSGVIAVHVGAGYHSDKLTPMYKKTCRNACIAAAQLLQAGMNAVDAVTEAVSVLEDCPLTNAGIGSNLSIEGIVECDAGIMDGKHLQFGSVGALSNIKNPIKVAQKVLEGQRNGLLPGGRIPPCTIVGTGAKHWALDNGFPFCDNQLLSTKSSEEVYRKNLTLFQKSSSSSQNILENPKDGDENMLLDTVGAVCADTFGNVASAVSSGGLLLKHSGRLGQAAVYGSGCWAENSSVYDKPSIACTVTGVGEYLIKTLFARECYQMVYNNPNSVTAVPDVFRKKFVDSPFLQNISCKLAGVMTLKHFFSENYCELAWAHNTKTMILGYMNSGSAKPITILSSQPTDSSSSTSIVGSERHINLKSEL